jgi:hypothetical protein
MKPRSRRPHGIASKKISISVSEDDLAVLVARAGRLHRGNVSAVVHEMVAALRRQDAQDELLAMLGGSRVSDAEVQALREEIAGLPRRGKRRPAA